MYNYLIRRKVFNFLGAKFHIYDNNNLLIGFCQQKAFKLKEDISVYTDETKAVELLNIKARNIIDFSACYDVFDSTTQEYLGAWRRKGWSSLIRDNWEMLDPCGNVLAELNEDNIELALVRRFATNLIPQGYQLTANGICQAIYSQRFNPFIFKLEVAITSNCQISPYLILAGAVLLSAIEGRQE